jgi:uncharacterized membrane protein YqgA involved in biofilm formation
MPFLGTIVNFFVVLVMGTLGSFMKRGVDKRVVDAMVCAMGICVVFIGIDGALESAPAVSEGAFFSAGLVKVLVMIISLGLGTLIGELVDFDKRVNALGDILAKRFSHGGESGSFSEGFAQCSILFCVGAMAVNGAFADALGKPDILLAKSVIDGIICFMMSTTLGIGCAFSAFPVLAYQGALTGLGYFLTDALPASTVTYMSVTGSLIILLIGTNLLGVTKVKTANMIPAIFLPIAVAPLILLFT